MEEIVFGEFGGVKEVRGKISYERKQSNLKIRKVTCKTRVPECQNDFRRYKIPDYQIPT